MCEGWLVTVCLSEHKWTLLSLLAQLFQTLSMLCVTLARQLRTTGHPDHCQSVPASRLGNCWRGDVSRAPRDTPLR